jgi:hypothetical protein
MSLLTANANFQRGKAHINGDLWCHGWDGDEISHTRGLKGLTLQLDANLVGILGTARFPVANFLLELDPQNWCTRLELDF